eukprot:14517471-Alexandrium_andersonii.AAC.1
MPAYSHARSPNPALPTLPLQQLTTWPARDSVTSASHTAHRLRTRSESAQAADHRILNTRLSRGGSKPKREITGARHRLR